MTSHTDQQSQEEVLKSHVVSWIKGDIGNDKQAALLKTRHPRTCEWLFQHTRFNSWLKATESTSLTLLAPPGAGKTVSASAVARLLEDRSHHTTVFFFSFNDPSRRTVITALRALSLDILAFYNYIPEAVQQLYKSDIMNGSTHLTDLGIATQVLKALIKQVNRVHILLDGLDECRDRRSLLPILGTLLESSTFGIVKWFFTSRPELDIHRWILQHHVLQIEAPIASIKEDISQFLHDTCTNDRWKQLITAVVERSEGNFLWATITLQVINNSTSIDEKDIVRELEKFPRDLNGLYLRVLHRLSKRKKRHQELAQKMFTILIASFQPLRLSELSEALAVNTSHPSSQSSPIPPESSLLEDLCSGLVVFDRSCSDGSEDPLLRFSHKSVHDFFLQSPEPEEMKKAGIPTYAAAQSLDDRHLEKKMQEASVKFIKAPPATKRFFLSMDAANLELGRVCLWYLYHTRYMRPGLQKELLCSGNHAFLKYAAVFWHAHLSRTTPTSIISQEVEDFLESSAFWNCVSVQCIVAPHIYAIYHQRRNLLRYQASVPRSFTGSNAADIHYGSPLPLWMNTPKAEDFGGFIAQWYRVLNSFPGCLNQCYMDDQWESRWPNIRMWFSKNVRCLAVPSGEMTLSDLIAAEMKKKQRQPTVKGSIQNTFSIHACGEYPSPYCPECLTTFPNKLITDTQVASDTDLGAPNLNSDAMFSPCNWWTVAYTSNLHNTKKSQVCEPYAVAMQWKCDSNEDKDFSDDRQNDYVHVSTSSNREPDLDSGLDSESVSESDAELDVESDSGSDESSPYASVQIHSVRRSIHRHCLVITREAAQPISYIWQSPYSDFVTRGAFHPRSPWLCWSPSVHEFCLVDTLTGLIERATLPEPPDVDFSSAKGLYKEIHASENGDYLVYLILVATPSGTGAQYQLSVSSFELVRTEGQPLEILAPIPSSTLSFSVDEDIDVPLVLTAWGPEDVYIALPPLSSKPKIVRLPLHSPNQNSHSIPPRLLTLREPIFFPSSTAFRHPRLLIDEEGKLGLSLGAQSISAESKEHSATMIGPCEDHNDNNDEQGPIIISWSLNPLTDWRDWDVSTDGDLVQYSSAMDQVIRLRGSYVNPGQHFYVSVRSGLNYRTKMIISCY